MSTLVQNTSSALNNTRKLVDNVQANLGSVTDPHATKVDASIATSTSGSTIRHEVVYSSPVDKLQADIRRGNFTRLGKTEVISSSLSTYQNILGGTGNTEFQLLTKLDSLIADFGGLTNNSDLPTKIAMIDKAETLAMSLSNTVNGIKSLRDTAHKDMLDELESLNSVVEQLFRINQQLHSMQPGSSASLRMYSVRDKLLTELSKDFSIKVDFATKSGAALVTLEGANTVLVSTEGYSRFSTSGALIQEADNMSTPQDLSINLTKIDHTGKALSTQVIQGGDGDRKGIIGGRIEGYITLRDDKLAKALEATRALSKTVAKTFNDIHNEGSTWPPATRMTGEMLGRAEDFASLSGTMTISSLDQDGKQLTGNGGRIHERKIDFDNLRTNSTDGKATIWDAVNEFNRVMDTNLTSERAAIGQMRFQGANGDQANTVISNDEFLINNVMLASTSSAEDIQNGIFSFDFDIDGNSYFGSEVEIKQIEVNGAALAGFDPALHNFTVGKDFSGRIGREINAGALNPGNNNIDVTVVVKGENGVAHTGKVRYVVDSGNLPTLNQRVQYDTTTALEGDFKAKVANQTGVGRLRFVDENGSDIDEGDINTAGRLIYESNTEEHRAALKGSNLMSLAGLNNFFSQEDDTISVRSDIVADPNKVAGGQVTKGKGITVATQVGDAKAAAEIQFTGGAGANFQANDSIFIGHIGNPPADPQYGTTITLLAAGPAGAGQAVVGADLSATIDNIVAALAADPLFNERFEASKIGAGNDTLKIEARQGGTWAHDVDVRVSLLAGLSSEINGSGNVVAGGPAINNDGNLRNGTDKNEKREIFNYTALSGNTINFERFGRLNQEVFSFEAEGLLPASYGTINGRISDILSLLINQQIDAKSENETTEKVADRFDIGFREQFGIDRQKILFESMELLGLLRVMGQFHAQIIQTTTKLQETIAAA